MADKYLKLNDIDACKVSFHLSNYVWDIIIEWKPFVQRTVCEQFVRAVDSISANIAEGFGRYFKNDKIKFFKYSHGSIKESLDWNENSKIRKLLTKDQYQYIFTELQKLPKATNRLIKFINAN